MFKGSILISYVYKAVETETKQNRPDKNCENSKRDLIVLTNKLQKAQLRMVSFYHKKTSFVGEFKVYCEEKKYIVSV